MILFIRLCKCFWTNESFCSSVVILQTQWRRMRSRASMKFSPGLWARTGGSSFLAFSNSETCCGLASSTERPSAAAAARRYDTKRDAWESTLINVSRLSDSALQVMAVASSHSVWQRTRSDHHSGAQRQYSDPGSPFPRGPAASPLSCALCNYGGRLHHGSSPTQAVEKSYTHSFIDAASLEVTPPRAAAAVASQRKTGKSRSQAQQSQHFCPEEIASRSQ